MKKFQFSTPMPFGNLDIHGNLSTLDKWVVFGELLGNNFIYQEVPVKELSLRLNSNEKEFVGTKEGVREYDYVLVGSRNDHGDLVITSGYWVKGPDGLDSRRDHPDYLTKISNPEKLERKSWNPGISIKLVDEILSKSY